MVVNNKDLLFKGEIISGPDKKRLDLINRKLLYLLSINARFSATSLAKSLKVSREVISYRIKKLEEEGFLHGFFTLVDVKKLGWQLHIIYVKLYNTKKYEEIIRYLLSEEIVTRLKETGGSYDLQVILTSRTLEELDSFLEKFFNEFSSEVKDYSLLRMVEEGFLGMGLLLEENEKKNIAVKDIKGSSFQKEFLKIRKGMERVTIDEVDKEILKLLNHNARMTIKQISASVNLSHTSVENRIRNLVMNGVIRSMYPLFSISQLGYQWFKVFVQVRNLDKTKFLEYLKSQKNILWYMKLIGKWDYQFSVFAKNNIEFFEILNSIRNEFSDNITSYDSLIILNQRKFVHRL